MDLFSSVDMSIWMMCCLFKVIPNPFANLRNIDLSSRKLSVDQRIYIGQEVASGRSSGADMARKYNLQPRYVTQQAEKVRHGSAFNKKPGHLSHLDEEAIKVVHDRVRTKRSLDLTSSEGEFIDLLIDQRTETKKRRGGNDLRETVSKSFVNSLIHDQDFKKGNPQRKTMARITAEADPRNSYSEALLFEAFQSGLDPALILNMDATQYFSPYNNEGTDTVLGFISTTGSASFCFFWCCAGLFKCVWEKDKLDSPVTCPASESGEMGIFIKSYTMGSAAGFMCPMVLVLADDTLGVEDIRVFKIAGISHLSDATSYGYLVFTKTRGGNRSFFRWFLEYVMCPYVNDVRLSLNLGDMNAFISTDGEQIQIETFIEPQCSEMLKAASILEAKHSASYSAKGNAWDAGNYFKATKCRAKSMHSGTVSSMTAAVRRNLDAILTELTHLDVGTRNHMANAVCRIVAACRATLTFSIIQGGFIETGQWDPALNPPGYNFDKKMGCCTSFIPPVDLTLMRSKLVELAALMRSQGLVTEAQYDVAGIIQVMDSRSTPKDQRPLHQNRAMLLNVAANLERVRVADALKAPIDRESLVLVRKQQRAKNELELRALTLQQKRKNAEEVEAAKTRNKEAKKAETDAKKALVCENKMVEAATKKAATATRRKLVAEQKQNRSCQK